MLKKKKKLRRNVLKDLPIEIWGIITNFLCSSKDIFNIRKTNREIYGVFEDREFFGCENIDFQVGGLIHLPRKDFMVVRKISLGKVTDDFKMQFGFVNGITDKKGTRTLNRMKKLREIDVLFRSNGFSPMFSSPSFDFTNQLLRNVDASIRNNIRKLTLRTRSNSERRHWDTNFLPLYPSLRELLIIHHGDNVYRLNTVTRRVSSLKSLPQLEKLVIINENSDVDPLILSSLTNKTRLRHLEITRSKVWLFGCLHEFVNLEVLIHDYNGRNPMNKGLDDTTFSNKERLYRNLKKLRTLRINAGFAVYVREKGCLIDFLISISDTLQLLRTKDLFDNELKVLKNLKCLFISSPNITDAGLIPLTRLKILEISNARKITNLSIENLKDLEILKFGRGCHADSIDELSIDAFRSLRKLRRFRIDESVLPQKLFDRRIELPRNCFLSICCGCYYRQGKGITKISGCKNCGETTERYECRRCGGRNRCSICKKKSVCEECAERCVDCGNVACRDCGRSCDQCFDFYCRKCDKFDNEVPEPREIYEMSDIGDPCLSCSECWSNQISNVEESMYDYMY